MISLTFDLTKSSQLDAAKKEFAIDLYSPSFAKNKLSKDTEKQIKPEEIRKQLKNIRTDLSISAEEAKQLPLVLAIIVSSLVDTKVAVSFVAKKGAEQWETFIVSADIQKIEALADKDLQRLIQPRGQYGQSPWLFAHQLSPHCRSIFKLPPKLITLEKHSFSSIRDFPRLCMNTN